MVVHDVASLLPGRPVPVSFWSKCRMGRLRTGDVGKSRDSDRGVLVFSIASPPKQLVLSNFCKKCHGFVRPANRPSKIAPTRPLTGSNLERGQALSIMEPAPGRARTRQVVRRFSCGMDVIFFGGVGLPSPPYGPGIRQVRRADFQSVRVLSTGRVVEDAATGRTWKSALRSRYSPGT